MVLKVGVVDMYIFLGGVQSHRHTSSVLTFGVLEAFFGVNARWAPDPVISGGTWGPYK